ncbi:hypothetical protein Vadar_032151 [Vaccinium darrowii]|uniref:Uncharacterized protein n=1 Tax=Vaccinium darrowii TaxID=229202 RepID=A0ACB7YRJ0_9ERIC|nr:hypothetical protein Vadar_032151 [Vaccinium darrowii]
MNPTAKTILNTLIFLSQYPKTSLRILFIFSEFLGILNNGLGQRMLTVPLIKYPTMKRENVCWRGEASGKEEGRYSHWRHSA